MRASDFNSDGKNKIRSVWNAPVLKYLSGKYDLKFSYLGLPGVELTDVLEWNEWIESVVAFEDAVGTGDKRDNIRKLRENLALMAMPQSTYYGSIERVVLMRKDLDDTDYVQERLITLYNLDFCSEITSRVLVRGGKRCLRFEVLKQLLRDQHESYLQSDRKRDFFVLLLTARNQTTGNNIHRYLLNGKMHSDTSDFIEQAKKKSDVPENNKTLRGSHGWALKALIHETLVCTYAEIPGVDCLVFPMVKYVGLTSASPMLHWMIICRFADKESSKSKTMPEDSLLLPTLSAESDFGLFPEPGESSELKVGLKDGIIDPVEFLKYYEDDFFNG